MRKVSLVFLSLLATVLLTACQTSTLPNLPVPLPIDAASGSLEGQAGLEVGASLFNGTDLLSLGTATIDANGDFSLDLVDTVGSEFLTPAEDLFACETDADFNVASIMSLNVNDGGNTTGLAYLVPPEYETEGGHPQSFVLFVYSDQEVTVEAECNPTATATMAGAASLVRIAIALEEGWNAILYSHVYGENHSDLTVTFRSIATLNLFTWLFVNLLV